MEVKIADSFFSSLKRLNQSENPWHWRYYVSKWRDLKWIFWAKRKYRKVVRKMRPWDYGSILQMLKFQIEILSEYIEFKGLEIDEDRLPKVDNMKRAIVLLHNKIEDDYATRCGYEESDFVFEETEDGMTQLKPDEPEVARHNERVFKDARELEEKEWNELFELLKEMRRWWD